MKNKLKMAFVHGSVGSWPSICHCIRSLMFCSWRKQYLSAQEQSEPTIMDKSPWDSNAIFIFFCHSGSLIKQCILFEIFLQFSLPHPIQRKNSGYTRPTLFVGWGEGTLGLCELENAQKCKSVPKLLSLIVVHLNFICFELLVNHILTFSFSFSYYPR